MSNLDKTYENINGNNEDEKNDLGTEQISKEKSDNAEKKMEKDNNTKTNKNQKIAYIVALIAVLVIAAVIVCISVFSNKSDKKNVLDSSTDMVTDYSVTIATENGENNVDSLDTKSITDTSNPISDIKNSDSSALSSENTAADNPSDNSDSPDIIQGIIDPENNSVVTDPPVEVIVTPSKDQSEWPSNKMPQGIPECRFIDIDTCTKMVDGSSTVWDISWTTTQANFDYWIAQFISKGFSESKELSYYYGNGDCVVSVSTEDNDGNLWVDMIINQSTPVDYKNSSLDGIFPEFDKGDATLEYWVDRTTSKSVTVQYACASNWDNLVNAYKSTLKNNGFTVDDTHAEVSINGNTYSVYFSGEKCKSAESLIYICG